MLICIINFRGTITTHGVISSWTLPATRLASSSTPVLWTGDMWETRGFRATMLAMRRVGTLRSTIQWRRVMTSSIASSLDEVSFVILSFLLLSWCFLQQLNSCDVCLSMSLFRSSCALFSLCLSVCHLSIEKQKYCVVLPWYLTEFIESMRAFILLNAPLTLSCDTSDFFWSNHDLGLSFVIHYKPIPTQMAGVWVHSLFKWPRG